MKLKSFCVSLKSFKIFEIVTVVAVTNLFLLRILIFLVRMWKLLKNPEKLAKPPSCLTFRAQLSHNENKKIMGHSICKIGIKMGVLSQSHRLVHGPCVHQNNIELWSQIFRISKFKWNLQIGWYYHAVPHGGVHNTSCGCTIHEV